MKVIEVAFQSALGKLVQVCVTETLETYYAGFVTYTEKRSGYKPGEKVMVKKSASTITREIPAKATTEPTDAELQTIETIFAR